MPVQPDFAHTTRQMGVHFGDGALCEITTRDTGDQDGASLSTGRVLFANEVFLTFCDEDAHLAPDVVPDPGCEGGKKPDYGKM